MSNYQVRMLMTAKEDRKYFHYLKIDHRRFYNIAVIDEFLKHIQMAVTEKDKKDVNLKFTLVEEIEIEGSDKKEKVELGEFDYGIKPTTKFLNDDRFYQIAETEIYLKSPNLDEAYKKSILENIKNSKVIKQQNTAGKGRGRFNAKGLVPPFLKKNSQAETLKDELEESDEQEKVSEGQQADEQQAAVQSVEQEQASQPDEDDTEPGETTEDDTEKDAAVTETDEAYEGDTEPVKENEVEEHAEEETPVKDQTPEFIAKMLEIPDFKMPKVKAKDIFLTQSDDPIENKRLSYLFDKETRLASHKETRLVEIYNTLVEKYEQYILANESDIEEKLKDYEQSREAFIEDFIKEIKEESKQRFDNKIIVLDERQTKELDDFKEEQQKALSRFEENQRTEKEEKSADYKTALQKEIKEEKQKAGQQFDVNKDNLKKQLREKVEEDVYQYVMLDKKSHIQTLNDELFERDEKAYQRLDSLLKEWQADAENQQQKNEKTQYEALEQAKYEAETEKAQAEILAARKKNVEVEEKKQSVREQELQQKQAEQAYKDEAQRLKARQIAVDEKQSAPLDKKRMGLFAGGGAAMMLLLTLSAQSMFGEDVTYAELIENQEYVEAYEAYPERYSDILNRTYENRHFDELQYLADQEEENEEVSDLYIALSVDNTNAIIEAYEGVQNKKILSDDVLKAVADQYLLQQDVEGAKAVNTHISDNEYTQTIVDVQNNLAAKEELEQVIANSDDSDDVSDERQELAQINTLLKIEEDTP